MVNVNQSPKTLYSNSGSRKTAIARAHFSINDDNDGKSQKIIVNGKAIDEYFNNKFLVNDILKPFKITKVIGKFNVKIIVQGGGISAQATAISLSCSKILAAISNDYKDELRLHGLLTRDAREKERRKYGFKKARKRPQFSKR